MDVFLYWPHKTSCIIINLLTRHKFYKMIYEMKENIDMNEITCGLVKTKMHLFCKVKVAVITIIRTRSYVEIIKVQPKEVN